MMRLASSRELSFEPASLWKFSKNRLLELVMNQGYHSQQQRLKMRAHKDWVTAGSGKHLSRWNAEYLKRIYEFFTFKGAVVFDPFSGHTSSIIPFLMKRRYIGIELNSERYHSQLKHLDFFAGLNDREGLVDLHLGDSRDFKVGDGVDAIITDPPFFTLERYDKEDSRNLSNIQDPKQWAIEVVRGIEPSAVNLRDGGFLIVKISDLKLQGKVLPLKKLLLDQILSSVNNVEFEQEICIESNPAKRHPLYSQAIAKGRCLSTFESLLIFRNYTNTQEYDLKVINSRPLVKDVYPSKNKLFWRKEAGKVCWITRSLDIEFRKSGIFLG